MAVQKADIRQLHVGKSYKERQEYINSLRPGYRFNKTEEKPSVFDETDSSSSRDPDKPLDGAKIKRRSPRLLIVDFIKGNWGVTIIGGLIVAIISVTVIGYFTLWSEQKAQNVEIANLQNNQTSITNKQDYLNDKIANFNTDFQVFKAGITKDIEFIKNKITIVNK